MEFYGGSLFTGAPNGVVTAACGHGGRRDRAPRRSTPTCRRSPCATSGGSSATGGPRRTPRSRPARWSARNLEGRVAIVTGASDGLGKQFAHGLAEAGATGRGGGAARATCWRRFAAELQRTSTGRPRSRSPTDVTSEAGGRRPRRADRRGVRHGSTCSSTTPARRGMQPFLEHGARANGSEVIEREPHRARS